MRECSFPPPAQASATDNDVILPAMNYVSVDGMRSSKLRSRRTPPQVCRCPADVRHTPVDDRQEFQPRLTDMLTEQLANYTGSEKR